MIGIAVGRVSGERVGSLVAWRDLISIVSMNNLSRHVQRCDGSFMEDHIPPV